jgi:dephospho-CoA kinase
MELNGARAQKLLESRQRPVAVGLTGPIAAGKSTIAKYLRERGAEIVDADRVYRSLLAPGSDLSRRIADRFGPTVVAANGEIDRSALSKLVFQDPKALADLDQITHPTVVDEIRKTIGRSTAAVVVVEAVKLGQSGLVSDVDSLWFVTADEPTRLRRLMTRSGMNEQEARARIAAAPGLVPADARIDYLIDTSCDVSATLRAVEDAWQALLSDIRNKRHDRVVSVQEEPS